MESSNAPKTKKLKGFTLLELIIVCALFSMILIGALSILRPVSLLYKQNVEYESSRATSDIVSTYLEGVLNYADRMYFYDNQGAAAYDEDLEFERFLNTYFKGSSGHQTIYIMDIINDPVIDGSGNIVEEGYGRVYMREVATGNTQIDDSVSPKYLAISDGIYEDYGFQINMMNALPRTLTTTVNVFKKSNSVTPTQILEQNGILSLVNASGQSLYESNGVEVVKSSNMLNICYYDVDLNSPTAIPNYVTVYDSEGNTTKEPSFYSNPNSSSITDATPISNNYHIIFTLPDQEYYKVAAENQLEYIDCTPKKIQVASGSTKTLDEVLEDAGFVVKAKYTNRNETYEIPKSLLNNGTDGWYVQNAKAYTDNINSEDEIVFYVYFESKMTQFTIKFKKQPLVNSITADKVFAKYGETITEDSFYVTVDRGGVTETISSSSYDIVRNDGGELSAIDTKTPGVYPVTVTYTGDDPSTTLTPSESVVIVPTLAGISTSAATVAFPVGTVLADENMQSLIVTATYHDVSYNGATYTVPAELVTDKCTFTYPNEALQEGRTDYSIGVAYMDGTNVLATTTIPITVSTSALSVSFTPQNLTNTPNNGSFDLAFTVSDPDNEGWSLTVKMPFNVGAAGAISCDSAYPCNVVQSTGDSITITGTGNISKVISVKIYYDGTALVVAQLVDTYNQLQAGTYALDYTITPTS